MAILPVWVNMVTTHLSWLCEASLLSHSGARDVVVRHAGLGVTGRKVLERFAVCNAVLTTFADGTTLLLAAPFSAWQEEFAVPLAVPDPNHWLVPLDPL